MNDALAGAGVKNVSKIPANQGRGHVIVSVEVQNGDLSKLADAVNKALTPHRKQVKPGVSIELAAKLDKQSAATALKALQSLQGVDAKNSSTDIERGIIAVRLTGGKALTIATIVAALKKAGIAASV